MFLLVLVRLHEYEDVRDKPQNSEKTADEGDCIDVANLIEEQRSDTAQHANNRQPNKKTENTPSKLLRMALLTEAEFASQLVIVKFRKRPTKVPAIFMEVEVSTNLPIVSEISNQLRPHPPATVMCFTSYRRDRGN